MRNGRSLFKASGKPTDAVLLHFRHIRFAVAGIIVRLCAIGSGTALECLDATLMVRAEGREIVHWDVGQFYFKRVIICGYMSPTMTMNRYPQRVQCIVVGQFLKRDAFAEL